MTKYLKWKILIIAIVVGMAFWKAYPPLDTYDNEGRIVEKGKVNLGLDLQGGMHLVLKVDTSELTPDEAKDAPDRALEIIRNRIDQFGVLEPSIQRQGRDHIIVQLPGITDRSRAIDIVGKTAHLEFKLVSDNISLIKMALEKEARRRVAEAAAAEEEVEREPQVREEAEEEISDYTAEEISDYSAQEIANYLEGYELKFFKREKRQMEPLLLEEKAELIGDMIIDATTEFSQTMFNQPYVSLTLNSKGAKIFDELTSRNVGKRLAIVLDDNVNSAPFIRERIPSGRAQITGNFSVDEANDLAIVLRAGALPAPVKIIEERTVGPTLGKDSVEQGVRAILIGGLIVLVFMALYYLISGLIADFALFLNLVLITGALGYFHGTLTLPGIAGLVLTIGMAVDANVLIFERIREESDVGKSIRAAIQSGFSRAFLTILDSNVTTLIAALVLFQFGTGPVRGFATILSIGILSSMFTALVVTRLLLDLLTTGEKKIDKLTMLRLIRKPNINFIGVRKIAYIVSLVAVVIGLLAFFQKGEKNYSIDFTGGTIQQFRFKDPIHIEDVRNVLRGVGLASASIQQFGNDKEVIIRSFEMEPGMIIEQFKESFKDNEFEILRVEKVGPSVGADLRDKAIKAFLIAMVCMVIYISFRFEFRFAIAAIVALLHDVLITVGALTITHREISTPVIAALLTIVGYSINDTIVVFDRIREDRKLMRKSSYQEIINTSINQTLSRTLLTSFTTLAVVLALYFLGGPVINDFAFVLLIGVMAGTYSSIFIASPILIDWPSKRIRK